MQTSEREVIGLIPAAGEAKRIAPIPCSKELFPVGFSAPSDQGVPLPKVACQYLIESMRTSGVENVFCVLREGKWDIPAYLQDGRALNVNLAYLMMGRPFGVPFTLDQAYPFVRDALIVCGFPDILFRPTDAFVHLLGRQAETGAEIVLGLFPTDRPQKVDMVEIDAHGRVRDIVIKPTQTSLRYTWLIAAWTPAFTSYMHSHVCGISNMEQDEPASGRSEIFLGDVIRSAIRDDMSVDTVNFAAGEYLDIGTSDDLSRAVRGTW